MINTIKRKKGLLAFALSVAMMVSMTPLTAFADSWTSTLEVNAEEYSVTVNYDSVTVTSGNPYGIKANALNGNTAVISGGDISVEVPGEIEQFGIEACAGDNWDPGYIEMTTGNIVSGNLGVGLYSTNNSKINVTVNGYIAAGMDTTNGSGEGVSVMAKDGSKTNLVVKGNIMTSTQGLYVQSTERDDTQTTSTASVEVYGNVTANAGDGIRFYGKAPSNDVLVTGTVSGNGYGVVTDISNGGIIGANNLTVWKVAASLGMFAACTETYNKSVTYTEDLDAAKATKYIIKSGEGVTPLKADGTALDKSHDFPVAKEGEKIIITAVNGGTVKKAYNDGVEITNKDENGFFYVVVPRGGGINLTADIAPDTVKVAVPTGKNYTYNGKKRVGVAAGKGYTLSGTASAVNAGSYKAKATLKDGYVWKVGSTDPKTISWKISKASNPLKVKGKTATVKYSKLKKADQTLAVTKVIKFTKDAKDKKVYTLSSAKKGSKDFKKYFKVNKTSGKVTVKKGLKKGDYKVKVKVKAKGNKNYKASGQKPVTFTVQVK